ncbi:MAG TPA: RluA family pseudouridine synthase [Bacillota bacterium]|nr:RluA family pseudouridine synthase [Peptococcaceae bacterium MAG4]NLW37593.1 RluA family pseudouridine synthase [Peptococcaceae bacterium]HPZ42578.1 RluA family pseudouridine synthase [Bacillota bacterium]HQD76783.1 RluA family pseudouridine synthase [Bacillota bacterium]HUM59664.1 RluA family pseudouridine synthase [Bacillota bacterium]
MKLERQVTAAEAGLSIEQFLRNVLGFSRSMVRRLKRLSGVLLNGQPVILSRRLKAGDRISVALQFNEFTNVLPQPIPIDFVFEDEHILVVNKPPGMLVHPLKHEQENTLANAVLHHYLEKGIEAAFRPVSRLDRNTSGLVVIAKHAYAAFRLGQQLPRGELQREYLAVVHGLIAQEQGIIDLPVARSVDSRVKRRVCPEGKKALTYYTVLKYLANATFLKLRLATGRTHQIRVHLSHIGHPLVGDTLYGGREEGISRQALHCSRVSLTHPVTGEGLTLEAPLPGDMQKLLYQD